jgi:hypothetical protein
MFKLFLGFLFSFIFLTTAFAAGSESYIEISSEAGIESSLVQDSVPDFIPTIIVFEIADRVSEKLITVYNSIDSKFEKCHFRFFFANLPPPAKLS